MTTWVRRAALILVPMIAVAASYPAWKPLVRKERWFVIASNVGQDSLRRLGLKSDQIGQDVLSAPPDSEISPQVTRMHSVYEKYLRYSGLSHADITGRRILELGPGFTMSVPLLFLADGASYAAGIDKFVPFQTAPYYERYYAHLRSTLNSDQQARFDNALHREPLALNGSVAGYIYGKDVQNVVNQLGAQSYDLIVSNAVLEEIYDPTPVLHAQDQLLRPGGAMVHIIDLRDYGMFSKHGFHPLEFLTVSDWLYRRMVEGSGQPDRRMMSYYRDAAGRMGYQTQIYIMHVLGHPAPMPEPKLEIQKGVDYTDTDLKLIADIRPRLQPQFRNLPDTELLAQSIIFVARKPGSQANGTQR
jgi:SAM-dependent methyltransferase